MTAETSKSHAPKFENLDGLRGIGAMIVLIGHTVLFWGGLPYGHIAAPVMVDMFFMLSGFVIAFAYEPKIAKGWGAVKFLEARVVRLYPLFLFSMVLGMVVNLIILYGQTEDWLAPVWQLGLGIFALPMIDPGGNTNIYPLNMPAWTLLYELLVNAVYIFVWRWLNIRMLIVFIVLGALGLIASVMAFSTLNIGPDIPSTIGAFARAWFGFFAGVLLFRLSAQKRTKQLPRTWLVFPLIGAVIGIAIFPLDGWWRQLTEVIVVILIGPVIIYCAQAMEPPKMFSKTFVWLGAMSYALYLIHWPLYSLALRIPPKLGLTVEQVAPWAGIVLMIVAVGMATLVERYYDRPVRAWLGNTLRGLRQGGKGPRTTKPDMPKVAPASVTE